MCTENNAFPLIAPQDYCYASLEGMGEIQAPSPLLSLTPITFGPLWQSLLLKCKQSWKRMYKFCSQRFFSQCIFKISFTCQPVQTSTYQKQRWLGHNFGKSFLISPIFPYQIKLNLLLDWLLPTLFPFILPNRPPFVWTVGWGTCSFLKVCVNTWE